jgi:hypothetical protein
MECDWWECYGSGGWIRFHRPTAQQRFGLYDKIPRLYLHAHLRLHVILVMHIMYKSYCDWSTCNRLVANWSWPCGKWCRWLWTMTWRVECVTASAIMDRLLYVHVTTGIYMQWASLDHFERVARVRQGTPIDVIKLYFVLRMLQDAENYWVFGVCPSSGILKKLENTTFRIQFPKHCVL